MIMITVPPLHSNVFVTTTRIVITFIAIIWGRIAWIIWIRFWVISRISAAEVQAKVNAIVGPSICCSYGGNKRYSTSSKYKLAIHGIIFLI